MRKPAVAPRLSTKHLPRLLLLGLIAQAFAAITATPVVVGSGAGTRLYGSVVADVADAGLSKSVWVAATLPNVSSLFLRTPGGGWTIWDGKSAPAALYQTSDDTALVDGLGGALDLSSVPGAQVYVGLARDWPTLLAKGEYALAYAVPAAAANTTTVYVASNGDDANAGTLAQPWRTIGHAAAVAGPGTTVYVRGGVYAERVSMSRSGSATGGEIRFAAYPGETPVLDGSTLTPAANDTSGLFQLTDVSYVTVSGFELRNFSSASASAIPAGISVVGAGEHIQLLNNHVHDIRTTVNSASGNAFGIAVYGSRAPAPLRFVRVEGNEVDHLTTGSSESLVLNGNVQFFSVANNVVHDNNNIGIDLSGDEGTAPDPAYDRARDGIVSGNRVYNISSYGNPAYGNNYAADGIYVDGGSRIIIERNTITAADIGMEVTSEHAGKLADYVVVRNNLITQSRTAGISIGGYDAQRGGTQHCTFANNTLYHNDSLQTGTGEFAIQFYVAQNTFDNNIVVANSQGIVLGQGASNANPLGMNGNLYFAGGTAPAWLWGGKTYNSLAAFQQASGNDAASSVADPQWLDAASADFRLGAGSPAIGRGLPLGEGVSGSLDLAGKARLRGAVVDVGALAQ
jgi:hypothetical protein